jgi:Bacterial CdiA-CT RNAse A domain
MAMGNVDIGDVSGSGEVSDLFRIKPSDTRTDSANSSNSILKIAADDSERRYSVDLREEEARGGHTLRDHVAKTDAYLIGVMNADYKRTISGNLEITEFRDAEGSFATREQANDHVNQLLKLERDKVDQVATGMEKKLTIESRIGSVTGYEAFRLNGDTDPYIRDTYGVRAVIINDSRSPRGYTVRTAFPVNQRRGGR